MSHSCKQRVLFLTLGMQVAVLCADASNECHVEGLPDNVQINGQVNIFKVPFGTRFHLQCLCPLHTPVWMVGHLEDWVFDLISVPVRCTNNSKTCNPPELSYIQSPKSGLYTIIDLNVQINQTTVLKCYRTSVSPDNPDQLLVIDVEHPTPLTSTSSSMASLPESSPSATNHFMSSMINSKVQKSTRISLPASTTFFASPSESPIPRRVDTTESIIGPSAPYLLVIVVFLLVLIAALISCIVVRKYKSTKSQRMKDNCVEDKKVREVKPLVIRERSLSSETPSPPMKEVTNLSKDPTLQGEHMEVTEEEIAAAISVIRAVNRQPSSTMTVARLGHARSSIILMSCSNLPAVTSSSSTCILENPGSHRMVELHKHHPSNRSLSSSSPDNARSSRCTTV